MKKLLSSLLFFILSGLILTSCGSARTIIYEPVIIPETIAISSVDVFHREDTVRVPESVQILFEKSLRKCLFWDGLLECGPGIRLEYRFIQYNEGNRLARYMFGGVGHTGEASLMIEVTYVTPDGIELGKVQTEGRIASGLFGGSSDNAVERAAEEIAQYTRSLKPCSF